MSWFQSFSMGSLFGGAQKSLRERFGQSPAPHVAFSQLRRDPGRFLRHHEVNVQGRYGDSSGPTDSMFIAEHDPIAMRRSSVDGSDQPVYRYHLMPKSAYQYWTLKPRPEHSFSTHKTQHIAMEHTIPDEDGGAPQQLGHRGRSATFAHMSSGRQQVFVTNKVDKCTVKRSNSVLSHNLPLQSWGNSDDSTQSGGGYDLEQSMLQHDPSASTYGPSTYRGPHRGRAVSLFMQSSRRGSLHIYGQGVTPGWDQEDSPNWNPTVTHHRMRPLTAQEIRRAAQIRLARKRRNALSLLQDPNKLQKAQSRFINSIDDVAAKMRRKLGM